MNAKEVQRPPHSGRKGQVGTCVVPADRAVINEWGHPELRSDVRTPETVIMTVATGPMADGAGCRVAGGGRRWPWVHGPDRPLLELIALLPGRVDSPVNGLVVRSFPA